MANPPKKKGTAGETELLRVLSLPGLVRTPPTTSYDLARPGLAPPIEVLATRPDHGEWLMTMRMEDFLHLLGDDECELHIEVKRYARFALHTIWNSKFGRKK